MAETLRSNSARAVPVAAAAVSNSGGTVTVPEVAETKGVMGEVWDAVEVAESDDVGSKVGVRDVVAVTVRVRVAGRVAVAWPVALGGNVFDAVGLGPGVKVDVRVAVTVGVLVGVRVGVRVAVAVAVRVSEEVDEGPADVALGDAVRVGVRVGEGVKVAGGEVTVNNPEMRVKGTPVPDGSLAAALPNVKAEDPGEALPSTLNRTLAMTPSPIAV